MLLHVKLFCVIILTILMPRICLSDDSIGCDSLEDLQESDNKESLDLLFSGVIQIFSDVKITSITSVTTNTGFDKFYIDAKLEEVDGRIDLVIFTTEHFERYAKEQISTNIVLNVKFVCPGGRKPTLLFSQSLKEDNYFEPKLSKDLYTFVIPTPLYNGFELTTFEEIYATDDDLWGEKIIFSSPDSEEYKILVGTLTKRNKKTSFASLKLMSILLSLNEKIEFSIIATDTGNPPKSSLPAKVVITPDTSNTLPRTPQFVKTVSYGRLTGDFQLASMEIVLDPATYSTDVSFKKLSDDDNIFQITNIDNVVYVTLAKELDLGITKGKDMLTFEIEASNSRLTETGRTGVSILFPQEPESHFKLELYTGKVFVKSNRLEIEEFELLLDEDKFDQLDFGLQGQHAELFVIEQNRNIVKLSLKPELSAQLWINMNYVSLKLFAKINSKQIASTSITMEVIHTILLFEKPAYTGSLDSDGALVLDTIVMFTNPDTTDDIAVQLLQPDAQLFSFTKKDNEIVLALKQDVNQSDLQKRTYLRLEIEASEPTTGVKASCLVFIEKPSKAIVIKYEKNIYEAQINNEAKLIAEDIVLEKKSYNDEIEFSLLGRDAEYFSYKQNENIITLTLKDTFDLSQHSESNSLWVEVRAFNQNEKLESFAVVVCSIDHEPIPEFENPNYSGELTEEGVLNIGKLVLKRPTWRTYTLIELSGDYIDCFEYNALENEVEISLKSDLPEETKLRNSIVLVVIASNNGVKGYSTVVISLPQAQDLSNIFKRTIQKGQILEEENTQVLKVDDIELVNQYNVVDFTCTLLGDESKSLDYSVIAPKNVIKLILTAELPNEIIHQKFYISLLLECQSKEDASIAGSTIIFLDLPGSGQIACPTPEPPTFIPEFQKGFYNFYAKPNYVGMLQSVNAIIKGSDDDVRYSLHVENEHLKSRINIGSISGEISLSGITSPGRYYFDIVAENVVTHGQSQAKARLDIEGLIQCDDHVSVANSLLIKYLDEEIEHDAILNGKFENCEFYVYSLEPDNQEYVKIDPVTKMLTMISTDREDSIFSNMISPQIQVKLKLDCSSTTSSLRRVERDLKDSDAFVENRSLVLTNDITFSKDVTVLSIMLVDINDNHPKFIYPTQERLVVGFPEEKISMRLFSEHVIQVIAIDRDEGLNARIRYSIQPNEHFQIDPITGEVYPYLNAMKGIKEISLSVYATDRDGDIDGLSSKFTMIVKVLTAEEFTLLTFVNDNFNDIDTLMEAAKKKIGIDLIAVRHATLSSNGKPTTDDVRTFRAGSDKFIQKVWTYAFKGDVPISSNDIKRMLSEGSSEMNIFAQTLEEVVAATDEFQMNRVQNVTGYIAGLCVLSVIIIVCIGFILWRFIYRKHAHFNDEPGNNLSSRGPTNQNFHLKQSADINIQKQADISNDSVYEPSFYSKRESVKILGTTTQESTDDGRRRQIEKLNSNMNGSIEEKTDGSESDSSNESLKPRATVTFNELVERIHIERDDEEKQNHK